MNTKKISISYYLMATVLIDVWDFKNNHEFYLIFAIHDGMSDRYLNFNSIFMHKERMGTHLGIYTN